MLHQVTQHAAAKKADAGDDALNRAADRVDMLEVVGSQPDDDESHEGCAESDKGVRAHARGFPAYFAIESDAGTDECCRKEAQSYLDHVGWRDEHDRIVSHERSR